MRYSSVRLVSLAYELPPNVVSSAALEDRLAPVYEKLRIPQGRLELLSGVRERRFWEPGTTPSQVSIRTAGAAIERAGVDRGRIGALLHTSVCRDFLEPATATVVAGALALPAASAVFDVSNACLGFLNGVVALANMIELGQVEAGVVVATEDGRPLVDATIDSLVEQARNGLNRKKLKPSFASLTIGSGSVAAVLCHASLRDGPSLLGGAFAQACEFNALCRSAPDQGFADGARPLMHTDAERVLLEGCQLARRAWDGCKQALAWTNETPRRIVCHQVGSSHRRALFEALELDVARDCPTLERLGNVGSVSLPLSLALAREQGLLEPGDPVALLGIGSGLNCIMLGLQWA